MFHHKHPYPPFIPPNATKLIVGTLPPPRFTSRELKEGDVDFCYGSRDGQLWFILGKIFDLKLTFENTEEAVFERKRFLEDNNLGICDVVESARRMKVDASDIGMEQVELRNMVSILEKNPKVNTLLFTGGNSKNGPEYFFRKVLKTHDLKLEVVTNISPKIHSFILPHSRRKITTISLIAPSGAANRAVGSLAEYKSMKSKNPKITPIDFRIWQYKPFLKP